ncbi:uncharacterized protein LOC133823923 [Humulus lupulus]|uniref:uncharacterized protein LOC133823923 n=1 Tax=Humulus lupulus TaxID=3486 RepID=UPI002B4103AB|nr:uncharacterized protein LOC133823923 [Humulus lupulus]
MNVAHASSSNGLVDEQCQYVNRNYNFRPNNNLPIYYHPGLRNHEKFSYANNRNVLQPPQEPSIKMGEKPSQSLEELLKTYIVDSKARLDQHDTRLNNIETRCTNIGATMKTLETQVDQLANTMKNQLSRSFLSDTEKNLKEYNAITLRSGKELEAPIVEKKNIEEIPKKCEKEVIKPKEEISKKDPLVKAIYEKFEKVLNIFKKIHINIPFVDALEEMSNYAKFMKERQLPEKLKDLGSFTIPCVIGELHIEKALYDLGASINLMSFSIFHKLNLGEVTPTIISIQLANRSLTYPTGIIEDVLVKIDRFIFPVDFVVLDMEEDQEIPIILGRPFLATGKALIDVHDGNLTLRVNGEELKFNISNDMRFPKEQAKCKRVDVVAPCLRDFFEDHVS